MLRWPRSRRYRRLLRPGCDGEGSWRVGLRMRPQGRERIEALLLTVSAAASRAPTTGKAMRTARSHESRPAHVRAAPPRKRAA